MKKAKKSGEKVNKNKQFAVNMAAQIVGFLVNMGISFLLTPFIVKHVGGEAYGFFGLANNFVGYAQVVTIALNSMAGRFITIAIHQNDCEESNKYFTSVVFANIILALILALPSALIVLNLSRIVNISDSILADVQVLWIFVFLNALLGIIAATYGVAAFARNKLYLTSIHGIISNLIKVAVLTAMFTLFRPAVWYMGLAIFSSAVYIFIWNLHYTKTLLPEIKVKREYFDFKIIRVLLASGIWNSFSKMSTILATGLDLLIANLYVGAVPMGVLSIAKIVPAAILLFTGTLASVYAPQLTISYAENNMEDMGRQLIASVKFLGIFTCVPIAVLFAYGDIFYSLWVPNQDSMLLYTLSILSCFEYMFILPLEGLWNVFTVMNKVKQTSMYSFFNAVITIAIVLAALQFTEDTAVKLYMIAGTSTVFSIIRALGFLPLYGAHCLKLKSHALYRVIFKNAFTVLSVTALSFLIKRCINAVTWKALIFESLMTGVISLGLGWLIMLNKSERSGIRKMILEKAVHKDM